MENRAATDTHYIPCKAENSMIKKQYAATFCLLVLTQFQLNFLYITLKIFALTEIEKSSL